MKVAAIFSNNMVLQREKNINIWGTGSDGDFVTVTIDNSSKTSKIKDNKWNIILPSMPAGGPYEVNVSDGKSLVKFSNVIVDL